MTPEERKQTQKVLTALTGSDFNDIQRQHHVQIWLGENGYENYYGGQNLHRVNWEAVHEFFDINDLKGAEACLLAQARNDCLCKDHD